jgi:hypothetical protein
LHICICEVKKKFFFKKLERILVDGI